MNKQINVYIISIVFLISQVAYAENATTTVSPSAAPSTTVQIKHAAEETPAMQTSDSGSINNNANQAQKKNNTASTIGYAVGGTLMIAGAYCAFMSSKSTPDSAMWATAAVMAFGMGGMAMMQGASNKSAAGSAGTTANRTASNTGFGMNKLADDPLADPLVKSMIDVDKAREGMEMAKKMGIDGKSPIKINGKEYKPSDFSNRESMLAAGLPKDAVDKVLAIAAKAESEALKRLNAMHAAGGFEDSSGATNAAKASAYNPNFSGAAPENSQSANRNVATVSVAGLTKNFNGEPIGVAADSIFAMMTRRYKLKEKQNSFIDESSTNLQK